MSRLDVPKGQAVRDQDVLGVCQRSAETISGPPASSGKEGKTLVDNLAKVRVDTRGVRDYPPGVIIIG